MNKEWLAHFGIKLKKKVDTSRFNDARRCKNQDIERIDRRCLSSFPISSSFAKRKNIYQCYNIAPKEKRIAIRAYEFYCGTKKQNIKNIKNKPKSYVQQMRDLHKKRLRRMLLNFGSVSCKRRLGPTIRTKSLNLSGSSPHFRYYQSSKQKLIRMRQLEYGLTKCARRLARNMRSCQVKLHKWDSLVMEAYTRRCRVLLDRMYTTKDSIDVVRKDPQPCVSISRLTPDQIATALLISQETLKHSTLEVRVTRWRERQNNFESPPRNLIRDGRSRMYQVYRQTSCETCSEFASQYTMDYQNEGRSDRYFSVTQDVFRNPIFLTPDSPSQQKTTLLEPEEINVPGDLSVISTDQDSGDSCEIASLVSSSTTSVIQPSDNSSFSLSCVNTRKRERTLSIAETKPVRDRNNSSFFRTSSYPLSSTESSRRFQSKQYDQRAFSNYVCSRDEKNGKMNSSSLCSIPRTSTRPKSKLWTVTKESLSPMLTRNRSKTFTCGVMMYINRSRSSSRSKSPRRS